MHFGIMTLRVGARELVTERGAAKVRASAVGAEAVLDRLIREGTGIQRRTPAQTASARWKNATTAR